MRCYLKKQRKAEIKPMDNIFLLSDGSERLQRLEQNFVVGGEGHRLPLRRRKEEDERRNVWREMIQIYFINFVLQFNNITVIDLTCMLHTAFTLLDDQCSHLSSFAVNQYNFVR